MTDDSGLRILNRVSHMDIFDLCDCLEDESIDMILCDLPYGITACEWDTVIPFEPMWECFKRVIKPRGAIVLTASGKFKYKLAASNMDMFKYEWVWEKSNAGDFMTAKIKPRQLHELILVFGAGKINYYPVMSKGKPYIDKPRNRSHRVLNSTMPNMGIVNIGQRFPSSVQQFSNGNNSIQHPTQKPVDLFEYLIRTYTQPGEVVFDPCCGSGTSAIAARNAGRNFICGDSSEEYVQVARARLALPYTLPMFEEAAEEKPVQAVMELG